MDEKAISSEVVGWIFCKPPSTLIMLRRMQKWGLNYIKRDFHNKHIIRHDLTPKGNKAYHNSLSYVSGVQTHSLLI